MSTDQPAITIEVQPISSHFPGWLEEAFLQRNADGLLVLYPNETSRRQALDLLSNQGLSVDTTHHLTLDRLVDLLYLDLKQPRKLQANPALFNVVHALTKECAEEGGLPLLFAPSKQKRTWKPHNTERLASLHRTLMELDNPWSWVQDPGAREFNQILHHTGRRLEGTHPVLVQRKLTKVLGESKLPFTLNDVDGIVMLDAAPDYTEAQVSFLRALSHHRPIHQLCNPGSFRLGHHGAYIDDVPYVTAETLPSWVPEHEVLKAEEAIAIDGHASPRYYRVQLHQRAHAFEAAIDLVRQYKASCQGSVLVVDGHADSTIDQWRLRLKELGLNLGRGTAPLDTVPGINHVLRLLRLGVGPDAWSMTQLRGLTAHTSLPIINGGVPDLEHPTRPDWKPKPHVEVLENMSRSFHVRGGPGALTRWARTLRNAQPSLGRDTEKARQSLEETQWWLACVSRLWAPFIEGDDIDAYTNRVIGCSSGEALPTPKALVHGEAFLNHLFSTLDWGELTQRTGAHDRTLPALQLLIAAHQNGFKQMKQAKIEPPKNGMAFIEHMEQLVAGTKMPSERSSSQDVRVLTPEEAHGSTADLVLLVGMDVDAWSMKLPKVPWLDAPTKLKLGMLHTDLAVRKGRHHLRHLLHAGPTVVVFDSTLEDGGGPAAPLAEWLSDAQRNGQYTEFQGAPDFLPPLAIEGDDASRAWQFDSTSPEHRWLSPRPFTMELSKGSVRGIRSGQRGRDKRQRTGLGLRERSGTEGKFNSIYGIAMAHEGSIMQDRKQRQPTFAGLKDNEYMSWTVRNMLVTTDILALEPSFGQAKIGHSKQPIWPHLGMKKGAKSRGIAIDPRPLPAPELPAGALLDVLGVHGPGVKRKVWSASRIQPWLTCPRQAWATSHLQAQDLEQESEDLDHRIRGQILHDSEAALMAAHEVPIGGKSLTTALPLHSGKVPTLQAGWESILIHLEASVPWLTRNDAIAAHRCRDLIGINPATWRQHLDGELTVEIGGRIGRLLEADYALADVAPLACEWVLKMSSGAAVELDAVNDSGKPAPFCIRGNADRVDEICLSPEMRTAAVDKGLLSATPKTTPVDVRHPTQSGGARRFVVIRDLKTVNGPKVKESGKRHLKALFNEVQLGLYARAWELAHPGDRVVGVGVGEVGESTTHYVELDPEIEPYLAGLHLGKRTSLVANQFRFSDDLEYQSNGFRAWMNERMQTARRAIDTAEAGHIHPVPSASCSFCKVRSICPSALLGGEAR